MTAISPSSLFLYKGAAPATTGALAGQIQIHTTAKSTLTPVGLKSRIAASP
jgi:hypothetical protein